MIFAVVEIEEGGANLREMNQDEVIRYLAQHPEWDEDRSAFVGRRWRLGEMMPYACGWIFSISRGK
jgi:hypothetical protein